MWSNQASGQTYPEEQLGSLTLKAGVETDRLVQLAHLSALQLQLLLRHLTRLTTRSTGTTKKFSYWARDCPDTGQ